MAPEPGDPAHDEGAGGARESAQARPGGGAHGAKRGVEPVLRASPHHERFLRHTLDARLDAPARELLGREWRFIGTLLGPRLGSLDVLDLACGSGPHVLAWAERGHRVTGIDFDRALLAAGRDRLARSARGRSASWSCGDATALPFRGASFDVVYCNSLLEHVPAWRRVLAEASRVLRPGGLLVVYTTNRICPLQQEVNHFPFYSWLPDPVQRRVLAWIMEHRRDLVNFTDFPAVNWFTFPTMRRAFRERALEPHDRLDLIASGPGAGLGARYARIASRWPAFKWPYYFYARAMGLYGIRRP